MLLLLFSGHRSSAAEQPSGGWRRASRRPGHWPREEIDDAAPPALPALPSMEGLEAPERPYSLTSHLRVEDYRGLEALAARAATRTLDDVIAARIGALTLDEAEARRRHRLREETEWILLFE
jgi:hypothetical protein